MYKWVRIREHDKFYFSVYLIIFELVDLDVWNHLL